MMQQWNYIDREKLKDVEKILSPCHFVHLKSHMYCSGHKPGPLQLSAPMVFKSCMEAASKVLAFYLNMMRTGPD
jgi:hypothetical protein